jgi:hypothetical protein
MIFDTPEKVVRLLFKGSIGFDCFADYFFTTFISTVMGEFDGVTFSYYYY